MVVSKPIRVLVEIEDMTTGCTYLYKGANVPDCVKYFQSLFFGNRKYKIIQCCTI
jgi:hypothetical protein